MNTKNVMSIGVMILLLWLYPVNRISAQFIDDFSKPVAADTSAINGWAFYTGDGNATIQFTSNNGYASILVDATADKRNVWWALIRRRVSADFDLTALSKSNYELRIEARIRSSHAPKRVNLHLNTQRTTDFHTHLMEFDIPDTATWHVISMTTQNFSIQPGDTIFGQLALMDWGLKKYRVDVDYFKVDVVNIKTAAPDKGIAVPYHPPIPATETFTQHLHVTHDCTINRAYADVNFNSWCTIDNQKRYVLLAVDEIKIVILKWDLRKYSGASVTGSGLLELTTYSSQTLHPNLKDFGLIRVVEIMDGDADWNQNTVTYNSFCQGEPLDNVLNSQMIIDVDAAKNQGDRNYITISRPVLQRLIDGTVKGLALCSLGSINTSFYASENKEHDIIPKLHLNIITGTD